MLVIKLKGPANLGNLQGPFEASIMNRNTWRTYAVNLDKMVTFFGADTMPDDILRSQVEEFREKLAEKYTKNGVSTIISAASSFYTWMNHMGFAATNPFRKLSHCNKPYKDVQVIA